MDDDSIIMPAFWPYPKEAAIIGRILAGYGELEFLLSMVLAEAVGDLSIASRVLFRTRGEEHRLSTADALLRPYVEKHALLESWERVRRATNWCKTTRNQYAHCHWLNDGGHGLFFTHIEKAAKSPTGMVNLEFFHVDVPLLTKIEEHFAYAALGLCYLRGELKLRTGKIQSHPFQAPGEKEAPPRHSSPGKHRLQSKVTI
jgi:hypothetical protein